MTVATDTRLTEFMPWDQFMRTFVWRQGEHVAAVAPTGAGKTTLFTELIKAKRPDGKPLRSHVIFFGTKPDDPLYRSLIRKHGFRRIHDMSELKPWDTRVLLWPSQGRTIKATVVNQQNVFRTALDVIVSQRAWTVFVDECKYMSEFLKLRTELTYALEQLRSINATVISGAQRPTYLPLSVLSNSTHVFLWRSGNRDDARKLADVGAIDPRAITEEMKTLGKHEFLYIHTRGTESRVIRSQVGK